MKQLRHNPRVFAAGFALLAIVPLYAYVNGSEDLSPELELLRPLVGRWVGKFDDPNEELRVLRAWTPILGGLAIRETRSVPDAGFEAESIFYYHPEDGVISYLGITNNGYVSQGQVVFDGEVLVQSGEMVWPDSSTHSIRVTFGFTDGDTLVNQLYNFENGEWQPSHRILYTADSDI